MYCACVRTRVRAEQEASWWRHQIYCLELCELVKSWFYIGAVNRMAKGRAPKDFVPDHAGDVGVDFELWLEDVNDYLEICGVSDNEDKKRLFLNFAGLAVRKVVKGLVIPAPPGATVDNPGDTYKALTDAVQAHFLTASTVARWDGVVVCWSAARASRIVSVRVHCCWYSGQYSSSWPAADRIKIPGD